MRECSSSKDDNFMMDTGLSPMLRNEYIFVLQVVIIGR